METRQACPPSTSYGSVHGWMSTEERQPARQCPSRPHRRWPPAAPSAHSSRGPSGPQRDGISRRQQLSLLSPLLLPLVSPGAVLAATTPPLPNAEGPPAVFVPNYAAPGPCQPLKLPQLEHTCTTCGAPAERSRLKIHSWVPKGGGRLGLEPPYPLAVITSGFLLPADQYTRYAEHLASWGYCVVSYDTSQAALDPVSDVVCVAMLRDLMDWCRTAAPFDRLCNTQRVLLAGHSRGGKISTLAAQQDERVKALFLLDPVDVTPYAPLSPGFPSAVAGLEALAASGRSLPVAVVGAALGSDCAPPNSNYKTFYEAAQAPAWEVEVSQAGHLQFLDSRGSNAMDFVCASGPAPDAAVAELTRAMMVAWAEVMVRGDGGAAGGAGVARKAGNAGGRGQGLSTSPGTPSRSSSLGLDRDGNVVVGLASFDTLQVLYGTEQAVQDKLGSKLDLASRIKNIGLTLG